MGQALHINNGLVSQIGTSVLNLETLDRTSAGTLILGGANATTLSLGVHADTTTINLGTGAGAAKTINIGAGPANTTISLDGNVTVLGTELVVGNSTFQGNIQLGDAAADDITFTAEVVSNITFRSGTNRSILVDGTAGNSLTLNAAGNSAGTGGTLLLRPGIGSTVEGSILFGAATNNTTEVNAYQIFADTAAAALTDKAGIRYNPVSNAWEISVDGSSDWNAIAAGGAMPTGTAYQIMRCTTGTTWEATNNLELPSGGDRFIDIRQVAGVGNNLLVTGGGSSGAAGGHLTLRGGTGNTHGDVRFGRWVDFYDTTDYARVDLRGTSIASSSGGFATGTRFHDTGNIGMVWEDKGAVEEPWVITAETAPAIIGTWMSFRGGAGPAGGRVEILGGAGLSGIGGPAMLQAGASGGISAGARVDIFAGSASGAGNDSGGHVNIRPGANTGTGLRGSVVYGTVGITTEAAYQILANTDATDSNKAGIRYNHSTDVWQYKLDGAGSWLNFADSSVGDLDLTGDGASVNDLVYVSNAGAPGARASLARANAEATARCVGVYVATDKVRQTRDATVAFTEVSGGAAGAPVWLSAATPGRATLTAPTATGEYQTFIGYLKAAVATSLATVVLQPARPIAL